MFRLNVLTLIAALLVFSVVSALASSVSMKISGPGAVDETTIKVGEKVTFDVYIENDGEYTFLNLGFKMTSPDIKTVEHPADSGNGRNARGDVKAFNGFEDASIFDMGGLHIVEKDWDGTMPELLGFGGLCVHNKYMPHENQKNMSFDLIFTEPGTFVVDSSFFPPMGIWMFAAPKHFPEWAGPYEFKVVK